MKKYFKLIFSFIAIVAIAIVVASCGKSKSTRVPEYTGMTLDTSNSGRQSKYMSAFMDPSLIADGNIEVPETEDEDETADKEKVEEEVKDSVTVNNEMNSNEYYAMPNDTIKVEVHINNPDECAILLFRLNGKTYQTYEFLAGSNSTLIIVEYKLDSTSGFKELTIDNLKYVDNADNQTKDCKMSGADTIKVLVQHTNIPNISITNVQTTFTTFSAKVTLKDDLNILQPNSAKLAVYEGNDLLQSFDLNVGDNTINLDQLAMGVSYSYYAVGAYDVCDGQGAKAYIFDEGKLATKEGYSFDLVGTTKNTVEFTSEQATDVATFEKVVLFDATGNAIKEATAPGAISFNGLNSNSSYKAVLYYSFMRNGEKITRGNDIEFDTLASEITISKFEIINDVVKPNEQINVSVEFVNPDNIRITSFILNGEKWSVLGGNQTTAAQLYFTAPDRKNETFDVKFEAIEYTFNGKEYTQKVDGEFVGTVQISDVLGMVSADFISEYSEPGVAMRNSNVLIVFNNPSNYEISKVYIDGQSSALVPIQVSPTEYIVSPDWIYNSLNITKFSYLVGDKEVNIEERRNVKLNALVGSPNINKITTADQLLAITNVADGTGKESGVIYQLQNDIDMTGKAWKPSRFFGVLDGNGYTIKNLQIADSSTEYKSFGMFTELCGMLVNVKLEDFYFNFEYNGGSGGVFAGGVWDGAIIQDCYAKNGTIIVKNGSFQQSSYWDGKGMYKEGTLSYAGAGEVVNTVLSNVKVYLGSTLVTTTATADAPVHTVENRMFENKSNDTFEYREFDKFVMITAYKSDSQDITLPAKINDKKVMYINNFLTGSTSKIKSAVFEEGIEYARYIFNNCTTLESVVLPSTMTIIGDNLFSGCWSLRNVVLPEGLVKIGSNAFSSCGLSDLELPNTVKSIGSNAFSWCNINTFFVPDSVTYVGSYGLRLQDNCVVVHQHDSLVPAGWDPQYNGSSTDSNKTDVIYNDGTKKIMLSVNANYDRDLKTLYTDKIEETPTFSIYEGTIEGWYLDNKFENAVEFPFVPENGGLTVIYGKVKRRVYVNYQQNLEEEYMYNWVDGYLPLTVNEPTLSIKGSYVEWYLDRALTEKVEFPWTITEVDKNKGNYFNLYGKAIAYDEKVEGDFAYYLDKDNNKILSSYNGNDDVVDLSAIQGLYGIASGAFSGTTVTKVIIPEGVTYIGSTAFNNLKSLKEVVIPSTVTTIGKSAFANSGLTKVELPDDLAVISDSAFYSCNSLQSVKLPKNLTTIGELAFYCCWNLKAIELPNGLKSIGPSAFVSNGIRLIIVPETVERVGHTGLMIENGVVVVPFARNAKPAGWNENYYAYEGLTNPPRIVYNDNTQAVTILSINGQYDTSTAQTVITGKINSAPQIDMYNGATIEGWYLDSEFTQEVEFPYEPGVGIYTIYAKVIGNLRVMFRSTNSTQSWDIVKEYEITLPGTIEYYEYEKVGKVLEGWYLDSTLTRKVTFPYEIASSSDSYLYLYPKFEDAVEETQGSFTYYLNKDNKKVLIGYDGDEGTVDLSVLVDLVSIGAKTFQNNKDLVNIIIPEGVESIGEYAFAGCSNLASVTLPSTLKRIGKSAFSNNRALRHITIPEGVTEIGESAFFDSGLYTVTLPSTLKTIRESAFQSCYYLYSATLPNSLEYVGTYAFAYTRIAVLDIPTSITHVGQAAFRPDGGFVVVHFAKKSRPNGWSEYFYTWGDSDTGAPTVIYDAGDAITILLIVDDNFDSSAKIKYSTKVSSKPTITPYNSRIAGWYTDKEFTNEVTFPYEPTNPGVYYLYAKLEFRTSINLYKGGNSYGAYYGETNGPMTVELDDVLNRISSYEGGIDKDKITLYYDSALTNVIDSASFPLTFEGNKNQISFTIYYQIDTE